MPFEIQRACPRPGQSRVIASGSEAIKTLERLTTLLPNAKIKFETLTIPSTETKKDEFGSMPDLRGPVPEIESTCHVFDAPCQTCEDDEDDITLAELKEQLEDDMTLAELRDRLLEEEEEEPIRLKKENYKNYENYEEKKETFEFVDEMTYYSRTCGELRNF